MVSKAGRSHKPRHRTSGVCYWELVTRRKLGEITPELLAAANRALRVSLDLA
jgi:hypothetical protein